MEALSEKELDFIIDILRSIHKSIPALTPLQRVWFSAEFDNDFMLLPQKLINIKRNLFPPEEMV